MNIEVNYNNNGTHEAIAEATIRGKFYYCICTGLAACGEPFYDTNFDKQITEEERDEMRNAARTRVRKEWDYDGSSWSEPIDEDYDGEAENF